MCGRCAKYKYHCVPRGTPRRKAVDPDDKCKRCRQIKRACSHTLPCEWCKKQGFVCGPSLNEEAFAREGEAEEVRRREREAREAEDGKTMDNDTVGETMEGENSGEEMNDILEDWAGRNSRNSDNYSAEPDIDSEEELTSLAFARKQKVPEARRHRPALGTVQGDIERGRDKRRRRVNMAGPGAAVAGNDIDSDEDLLSTLARASTFARARRQKAPEVRRQKRPPIVPKAAIGDYDSESASNYEPDDETGSDVFGDGSQVGPAMISSRHSELGSDIDFNSNSAKLRDTTDIVGIKGNVDVKIEIKSEHDY